MEDEEIRKLLQVQHGKAERRSWRCPDENKLAAYLTQSLSGSARKSVEAHVADCDFCLGQVAFLTHSVDWVNSEAVPIQLLSRARKLVTGKPGKVINPGWRWAVSAAAVACFALILFVALQVRKQPSVSSSTGPLLAQASPEPVASPQLNAPPPALHSESPRALPTPTKRSSESSIVRGKTVDDLVPKLIFPRDGAVVRREDLEFRWEPVSDAISYDVRVMSAEGDLVFSGQTENTRLKLAPTAPLVPGTKYFVIARAQLRQGKVAKSTVVSFRLAER